MSYIESSMSGFSQAVISFWFKVPQASLDAAQEEEDAFYDADDPGDPPPLLGLVPLVVFGKEGTSRVSSEGSGEDAGEKTSTSVTSCVEHASDSFDGFTLKMWAWSECDGPSTSERPIPKATVSYSSVPGKPTNPSYVAVDGSGRLQINFESTQTGDVTLASVITAFTGKYYTQETVNQCWTFPNIGYCGGYEDSVENFGGFAGIMTVVFTLIGWRMVTAVPDFYVDQGSSPREDHKSTREWGSAPGDMGTGAIGCSPTNVGADQWHHVLISVDLSDGSASTGVAAGESPGDPASRITATSEMHVAVDDKNYKTGRYPFHDTNKVVTGGALAIASMSQSSDWDDDGNRTPVGSIPSYSLTEMSVPGGDIGMPAHGQYVDHVYHCEMAEFQMWTDKTLDTSVVSNRRALLDYKRDSSGAPIPDKDGNIRLKPVKPDVAEELLGKPDINMHGSNKWIDGVNLGSGGSFSPTGEIKKYKPDPAVRPRG